MTKEEKQLLLKDLCARLPYGVMCRMNGGGFETIEEDKLTAIGLFQFVEEGLECIPFLRPMSSITEDEKDDFKRQFGFELHINEMWGHSLIWNTGSSDEYIDVEFELVDMDLISTWLDRNMFDWRRIRRENKQVSMIKAGLAIEAPEGMYKID